jgi:hypothetical protein
VDAAAGAECGSSVPWRPGSGAGSAAAAGRGGGGGDGDGGRAAVAASGSAVLVRAWGRLAVEVRRRGFGAVREPSERAVRESRYSEPLERAVRESRQREPSERAVRESRQREPSESRSGKWRLPAQRWGAATRAFFNGSPTAV